MRENENDQGSELDENMMASGAPHGSCLAPVYRFVAVSVAVSKFILVWDRHCRSRGDTPLLSNRNIFPDERY